MKDILNDSKFRNLLFKKQKYELFSWLVPLISILSLIIILILTTKNDLTELTIIILILLLFLIVGGYIFDNKLTIIIQNIYQELNDYFQNEIVPKLIAHDNPTIKFTEKAAITKEKIDEVYIFNNYVEYKSQYNYQGLLNKRKYRFHELLFDKVVNFDTKGKKGLNEQLQKDLNYHWYEIELNKKYVNEALFLISKFENFTTNLVKDLVSNTENFRTILNYDYNFDFELYTKTDEIDNEYLKEEIFAIFQDEQIIGKHILAIYVKGNHLNIILEEEDYLIDFSKSKKIVVETLLEGYYEEQNLIKKIVAAFDS